MRSVAKMADGQPLARTLRGWARTARLRWALAAFSVAVAALVAGCGGSSSTQTTPSASQAPQSSAPAGGGTTVTATETEYKITLSRTSFTPGTYTFVAKDSGHVPHALEINGPGVSNQVIPQTLQPGQSSNLTVTLKAGTYEIWCPVDGHKGLGMDLKVHVG